jgi:hypothetical protein
MWERGFWQFVVTSCQKISYHLKNDVSSHAKILGRDINRVQTGLRTKIGTRGIGKHNSYKWNWSIDALVFVNSSATSWAPTTKSSSVSLRISSYESTKRVYEPFNIHFIGGLADTPLYIYYKE